jgi:hypothetical protein
MSFSVPCLLFFFFPGQVSVCPVGYAGLSQGWLWDYRMLLICSPVHLCLPKRFIACVEWHRSPPVFSVVWRSFVQAGGLGCQSFAYSWCFFLPIVAHDSQQDFWFTELTLSASSLYLPSWILWDRILRTIFPRLIVNCHPPDLCLLCSKSTGIIHQHLEIMDYFIITCSAMDRWSSKTIRK